MCVSHSAARNVRKQYQEMEIIACTQKRGPEVSMETQKGEIVLYIYHINENRNQPDTAGTAQSKEVKFFRQQAESAQPLINGGAKRQGKLLSPVFLPRAVSHYLAVHCAPDCPKYSELPPVSAWRIQKGDHGKPYFPDCPWLHFSISHSGEYWACAMASMEVGLDLQIHTRGRKEQISARFFHPRENEYLRRRSCQGFFDIWAAKESYVKYTGRGIDENFAAFTAAAPASLADEINGVRLKFLPFRPGYSLCLCAPRIENVIVHYEV